MLINETICQLNASLDMKILFGKITHLSDPEIRKIPVRDLQVVFLSEDTFSVNKTSPFYAFVWTNFKFPLPVRKLGRLFSHAYKIIDHHLL